MLHTLLKEHYGFSNYEIAQIKYVIKTLSSELSKFLIMLILFHKHLPLYFFAITILCIIRMSAGGLHCSTYISCLCLTLSYMVLAMFILPYITIPLHIRWLLVCICIMANHRLAPITSVRHAPMPDKAKIISKRLSTLFLILCLFTMVVIPDNRFFITGFWIIILHAVQLISAHIKQISLRQKSNNYI